MAEFAKGTTVSPEKSQAEIRATLTRFRCEGYRFAESRREGAAIEFQARGRWVRFVIKTPRADQFTHSKRRGASIRNTPQQQERLRAAAERELWRALALSIKAKLAAVEAGIAMFEEEFLANVVDPVTRRTVSELVIPWIDDRHQHGAAAAPLGLPGPEQPRESRR